MPRTQPIRVLQVVGSMNRGGAETWLMHILRHIDRDRFQIDFLVESDQPAAYDNEIRALGSRIIPCLNPRRPIAYRRKLQQILRSYGPYDIVHSHEHHYSGYILLLAYQAGVPVRIAHSHSDISRVQAHAGVARRAYYRLMKHWLDRYATAGLGVSGKAAASLFGASWQRDQRWQVLHCGIDLAPFEQPEDRATARAELGIPADALVIGHVGRFIEVKNHAFLLDIAAELVRDAPHMRLLLVGDGPLRAATEQKVAQLGLTNHAAFAGQRADVPRLMRAAIDSFVLPSLYEGLPLVGMEVQAAGLPLIVSDTVSEEVAVIPQLVWRLSLAQPASVWAKTILAAQAARATITSSDSLTLMQKSSFNIHHSLQRLQEYCDRS